MRNTYFALKKNHDTQEKHLAAPVLAGCVGTDSKHN